MVLLGNIVFSIIEGRTAETEVRSLSSDVSALELDYLSLSNKVNLDLSYQMGFVEVKAKFATRKSISPIGSINVARNDI